jgi:hypothetical protein
VGLRRLLAAAVEAGSPEAKAQATITSRLRGGFAKPRRPFGPSGRSAA